MAFTKRGMSIPEYLKWRTRATEAIMKPLKSFASEQEMLGSSRLHGKNYADALKFLIGVDGLTLDELAAEIRSWKDWMHS